jgi:hypothetical protein
MRHHIPDHHDTASSTTIERPCRIHKRICPTVVLTWDKCQLREAWDCWGRQIEPPRKEKSE